MLMAPFVPTGEVTGFGDEGRRRGRGCRFFSSLDTTWSSASPGLVSAGGLGGPGQSRSARGVLMMGRDPQMLNFRSSVSTMHDTMHESSLQVTICSGESGECNYFVWYVIFINNDLFNTYAI